MIRPRIGLGFDLHRLEAGRPCRLGGMTLDHPTGPAGHSDGDAVLHAITDALLGAAGLDDIGTLFPDTDAAHKDKDSAIFLQAAVQAIQTEGYAVGNVDVVIATEGPRIAPHRAAMRARLADLLGVEVSAVNVKGKTLEGMGALAQGAGVAVQAICMLMPKPERPA
jgi:2-C-methyl-D-erythritol 2,4-cyclodiphosphate synthase